MRRVGAGSISRGSLAELRLALGLEPEGSPETPGGSFAAVGMARAGEGHGVLLLRHAAPVFPMTCLRLVQIVAGQTVTVLAGQGGSGSRAAVAALAAAIDARDNYTLSHSKEVVELAGAVAKRLGLSDAEIAQVRDGAMLHDVGKVAIPNEILNKPGPLDEAEWKIMREHPVIGEQILLRTPELVRIAPLVRHEHERWDGAGYPDGLAGEAIPIGSRIIFACDAYNAMITARPYREPTGARGGRGRAAAGRGHAVRPGGGGRAAPRAAGARAADRPPPAGSVPRVGAHEIQPVAEARPSGPAAADAGLLRVLRGRPLRRRPAGDGPRADREIPSARGCSCWRATQTVARSASPPSSGPGRRSAPRGIGVMNDLFVARGARERAGRCADRGVRRALPRARRHLARLADGGGQPSRPGRLRARGRRARRALARLLAGGLARGDDARLVGEHDRRGPAGELLRGHRRRRGRAGGAGGRRGLSRLRGVAHLAVAAVGDSARRDQPQEDPEPTTEVDAGAGHVRDVRSGKRR